MKILFKRLRAFTSIVISLGLLIIFGGAGCPPNDETTTGPDEQISQTLLNEIHLPYFLLNRSDWIDFDPGKIEDSISTNIQGSSKAVTIHDKSVIDWANKPDVDKAGKIRILKPTVEKYPVKKMVITREKGEVSTDVILDAKVMGGLSVGPFFDTSGATSRFYAFKANLLRHKAKYTFSVSDLEKLGMGNEFDLDLRGLPRTYYAFENLKSESGRNLKSSAGGSGGFAIFTISGKGSVKYNRNKVIGFNNKVFGVSFMEEPSYNSDQAWLQTGNPLYSLQVSFSDSISDLNLGTKKDEFLAWKSEQVGFEKPKRIRRFVVADQNTKRKYKVEIWKKEPKTSSNKLEIKESITVLEYLNDKTDDPMANHISINDGQKFPLKPNVPQLISNDPTEKDFYSSNWVRYTPGSSIKFIFVSLEWRFRKDFVEFEF